MNKTELIERVAAKNKMTKKDTAMAINGMLDVLTQALERGEKTQLIGFGSFEVKERAARVGRNPRTKEAVKIPAVRTPVFKPGKKFKGKVNQA